MSEKDTIVEAIDSIASNDQSNRGVPPDGTHIHVMVIDDNAIKQARFYVELELIKENPQLQLRFLIKKGTIVPGWMLEGLDNPPIEYFDGREDFQPALERLFGEGLMQEFKDGRAIPRILT